jgi:LysR family transcriptional regulator, pca operon transcriptional activator
LPLPFAGTDEPVGLIRRSDTQPSPVGRAFIDAVREVAQSRMAASGGKLASKPVRKRVRRTAAAK